jgi:hypothetical protein
VPAKNHLALGLFDRGLVSLELCAPVLVCKDDGRPNLSAIDIDIGAIVIGTIGSPSSLRHLAKLFKTFIKTAAY